MATINNKEELPKKTSRRGRPPKATKAGVNVVKEEKIIEKTVDNRELRKEAARRKRELKIRASEIEVEVENVSDTVVFFKSKRTGEILRFERTGDRLFVSVETLIDMKNQSRSLFEEYCLSMVDILDDEFSLDDVHNLLGLNKVPELAEGIESLNNFILDTSNDEFQSKFENMTDDNLKRRIIIHSVILSREGLLDSSFKENLLKGFTGNEYLFG